MSDRIPFCRGDKVSLRALERSDLGEAYLGWLNDPEVNRHLFVGRRPTSFDELVDYFERARRDPDTVLFAVVDNADGRHVGNVKMQMYDSVSRVVDWGVVIGEKERWGQGLATEALALSVRFAFEKWNAHKVTLGVVEGHEAALRAYEAAGFVQEGRQRGQVFEDGRYVDAILMGLLREEWADRRPPA